MAASISDDIRSISLHNLRPVVLHGYVFPFIFLYSIWLYFWVGVYGINEYFEAGLIALAIVGCVQILVCLFCHWSVHVRCSLTCTAVSCRPALCNMFHFVFTYHTKIRLHIVNSIEDR